MASGRAKENPLGIPFTGKFDEQRDIIRVLSELEHSKVCVISLIGAESGIRATMHLDRKDNLVITFFFLQ